MTNTTESALAPPAREVSTAEELDALPLGSVIIDSAGAAWQQSVIGGRAAWFQATTASGFLFSSNLVKGKFAPALLVWHPAPWEVSA